MPNDLVYTIAQTRAKSLYPVYERKAELQHQTHYCPGCGHGMVHKMLARAIDDLGIQNRTILISPVGCSVFAYYYLDVGNVQAAHGRAPAVATAVKRAHPQSIVISYQGDGDLSAIGSAEILHAANRGEPISVLFINNAIYSMTGGQMAPTSLVGQKSTTTPAGRDPSSEGYPLRMSELLATLEAPVYIERVALGDNKQIAQAARAVRRAVENQVRGLGFSLVEILSPCPTIWKLPPVEAQRWVRDVMEKTFPLGVLRDHTKEAQPRSEPATPPALDEIPRILGCAGESAAGPGHDLQNEADDTSQEAVLKGHGFSRAEMEDKINGALAPEGSLSSEIAHPIDLQVRIAGFGGQGVLLLGEVLAEAAVDAGLEVSWLPSYGPEMRSGTSNCHVRLSRQPIDTPLVNEPDVLVAMNEPSLHKFASHVRPGGWILYNGDTFPAECERPGVHVLASPFTHIAAELGDERAANMVALGALLEINDVLPQATIDAALRRLVKNPRWLSLDERALARGRAVLRQSLAEVIHA
ncbi:MAG TPA: 2-oxoacid:acceptor oxidoreductase family protein [Acidobacteriaceae bacterium]|nr:2-oxoacid:acceptor oxidoreductase family protein [Acidobacteriaceae bacterium]